MLPLPEKDKAAAPLDWQPDEPLPPDINATVLGKLFSRPNGNANPPDAIEPFVPGVPIAFSGPFRPTARRVPAGASKKGKGWLLALLAVVLLSGLALLGYWFIPWK